MCEKKINQIIDLILEYVIFFLRKKIIQKIIQALKYNQNVCHEIGKKYMREEIVKQCIFSFSNLKLELYCQKNLV